jgi:hypothetical protein
LLSIFHLNITDQLHQRKFGMDQHYFADITPTH